MTASGFFNVTVDVHRDKRGTAYRQWERSVDVAEANLFDVEMAPRLTSVAPQLGSLAGGTELTINGAGFGGDAAALSVSVGGTPCSISALTPTSIYCRVAFRPQTEPAFAEPVAAERGARWSAGATELRLADFSVKGWVAALDGGAAGFVEGWYATSTYLLWLYSLWRYLLWRGGLVRDFLTLTLTAIVARVTLTLTLTLTPDHWP